MSRTSVVIALLAASVVGPVAAQELAPCDAPDAAPWVTGLRDRVLALDGLAHHAVARFGEPEACVGAVLDTFDGLEFGEVRLTFPGGATLEVETFPPESSVATLRADEGLGPEEEAMRVLAAYAEGIGLDIDWSAPTEEQADGGILRSWSGPEEGLNATASLILRGDRIVGMRLSMAL